MAGAQEGGEAEALTLAGGDAFDDICDQIRMLRASVTPSALAAAGVLVDRAPPLPQRHGRGRAAPLMEPLAPSPMAVVAAAAHAAAVTAAAPLPPAMPRPPGTPPVVRRPSQLPLLEQLSPPDVAQGAFSVAAEPGPATPLRGRGGWGRDATPPDGPDAAGGGLRSPIGVPMSYDIGGAVEVFGGACGSSFNRGLPQPRAFRLTLWQERQLRICFESWLQVCPPPVYHLGHRGSLTRVGGEAAGRMAAAVSSGSAPPLWQQPTPQRPSTPQLPPTPPAEAPALPRWYEECFREWQQHTAARRAEEIGLSVRLLNAQVGVQLRRGLAHWAAQARDGVVRRARRRSEAVKGALKRWRRFATEHGRQRVAADQACMILRVLDIKRSLSVWGAARPTRRREEARAKAREAALVVLAKRLAVRRWADFWRGPGQRRRLVERRRRQAAIDVRASVFRRLRQRAEAAKHRAGSAAAAKAELRRHAMRSAVRALAIWSLGRTLRRRLLREHIQDRVHPRLVQEAFYTWAAGVRREQRHYVAFQRASVVMALAAKSRAFHAWRSVVRFVMEVVGRVSKSCDGWMRELLVEQLRAWRAAGLRQRRNRGVVAAIDGVRATQLMGAHFQAISRYVGFVRRQRRWRESADQAREEELCCRFFAALARYAKYRREKQQKASRALAFDLTRLIASYLRLWRCGARLSCRERWAETTALGCRSRRSILVNFRQWRSAVVEAKRDTLNDRQSSGYRATALQRGALRSWVRYLRRRMGKRRDEHKRLTLANGARWRRRRCLRSWAAVHAAELRWRAADGRRLEVAMRALLSWRQAVRDEAERSLEVRSAIQELRRRRIVACWRDLHAAQGVYRTSGLRGLVAWALGLWRSVLDDRDARHAMCLDTAWGSQCLRSLRFGFGAWWAYLLGVRDMRQRLDAFASAMRAAVRTRHNEACSEAMEVWMQWVDDCRQEEDFELQGEVFHGWARACREAMNRRGVHFMCDRLSRSRMLKRALASWRAGCERIAWLGEALVLWGAGVATRRAIGMFQAWALHATSRRRTKRSAESWRSRRRQVVLATWRQSLLMRLAFTGVVATMHFNRQRAWLQAWRSWATASAARRTVDALRLQAVRRARQLRTFDRWRDANRLNRLDCVAQAWDDHGSSRDLVRLAMFAWCAAMALYVRAERAAARIGAMRARSVLRSIQRLQTAYEIRPRKLASLAMRGFRRARARHAEQRRRLEALGARGASPGLRALAEHRQAWRRRREAADALLARLSSSDLGAALTCWRRRAMEAARSRRTEQSHAAIVAAADGRREAEIRSLTPHIFARWRDAIDVRKVKRFRADHPRLAQELSGLRTRDAFFEALARRAERSRQSRRRASQVRSGLLQNCAPRHLRAWAEAYRRQRICSCARQRFVRFEVTRVLQAWARIAGFRMRLVVHCSEMEVLNRRQLTDAALRLWLRHAHVLRDLGIFSGRSSRAFVARILRMWREQHDMRIETRHALQDLRAATRALRCRRRARALLMSVRMGLQRGAFEAVARSAKKGKARRLATAAFAREVRIERTHRRLAAWRVCARAEERVAEVLSVAWAAWAGFFEQSAGQVRSAGRLRGRREASAVAAVFRPWCLAASSQRRRRRASEALVVARARRSGERRLRAWRSWAQMRRWYSGVVLHHRSRWAALPVHRCLTTWRRHVSMLTGAAERIVLKNSESAHACITAWADRVGGVAVSRQRGVEMCGFILASWASRAVKEWFVSARRRMGARRLFGCMEQVDGKWVREPMWRARATTDAALRAMFQRFAAAFDRRRQELGAFDRRPLAHGTAFESVVALVWARQQMSVALGRLKGYPQPWAIGAWLNGPDPLLPPDNLYCMQAEMRLSVMLSSLEEASGRAASLFASMCEGGAQRSEEVEAAPEQRALMWNALADLLVVHRPGWSAQSHMSHESLAHEAVAPQPPYHVVAASPPHAAWPHYGPPGAGVSHGGGGGYCGGPPFGVPPHGGAVWSHFGAPGPFSPRMAPATHTGIGFASPLRVPLPSVPSLYSDFSAHSCAAGPPLSPRQQAPPPMQPHPGFQPHVQMRLPPQVPGAREPMALPNFGRPPARNGPPPPPALGHPPPPAAWGRDARGQVHPMPQLSPRVGGCHPPSGFLDVSGGCRLGGGAAACGVLKCTGGELCPSPSFGVADQAAGPIAEPIAEAAGA